MVTKTINIEVKDGDVKELNQDIEKVNSGIKETEKSSQDLAKQNKTTSGTFKGMATAVRAVGTALKAAGIGLVIGLFAKLSDMVSQNQKVLDVLSTVTTSLGIVFNDLFSIFDNGLPSISSIGKAIWDNIVERFNSTIEFAGLVGKAIKQLFEGDFAGALDTATEAGKEFADALTGIDNSVDKVTKYTKEVVETADAFVKLENSAKLAEAQLRRVFEQADRDAEVQRRIRDDFNKTFDERIKASERLKEILDEQESTQLRLANIEVKRAQDAIRINGDSVENQVALINALAERDAIEADIAGRRAEQESQDRALRKEMMDARKEDLENGKVETIDSYREISEAEDESNQYNLDSTLKMNEKKAKSAQALEDFKVQVASNGLNALASLAKEGSGFAKGVAVAQAIMTTYQGINKALAETTDFTPTQTLRFANAAAVGIAGFANVAKILSTNEVGVKSSPKGGGASGGGGVSAPSFNIVGTSGTNQLAESLQQDQQPIQAYVVGSNVTTQQELDRNIVDTATIG